jgi:hypothetical protein
MRQRSASSLDIVSKVLRRGAWILVLAYAFRLEQFLTWYPYSRLHDVLRVDTLNCIAACSIVIGLFCVPFKARRTNMIAAGLAAATVIFITPFVYPVRPAVSPLLLAYLNGNGNPAYFSLFPWMIFAFTGLFFGYALLEARDAGREPTFFSGVAVVAICAYAIGWFMSYTSIFEYGFFDYSLTSPHFAFIRLGLLGLILYGSYRWCNRKNAAAWSPLRAMGQASLLVYWIHIEIVYGRPFFIGQSLPLSAAAMQLTWLVPLMIGLAALRQYGFLKLLGAGALVCRRAISFAR